MIFQIGDKVVYPNQGVGTIENISMRSFGSNCEKFYLLRFGCNSMTVLVPFSNAASIGLRHTADNVTCIGCSGNKRAVFKPLISRSGIA